MTRSQGTDPQDKKSVAARRKASEKAHDRKIDSLLAKKATVQTPPPQPSADGYLRQVYRRRSGGNVEVLDLRAADAPAGSAAPDEAEPYAAHCVEHDATATFADLGAATRAARSSADWCSGCAHAPDMKAKVSGRAAKQGR